MSKICAISLCLILTLWSIPQASKVSADIQTCSQFLSTQFGYAYNNGYYDVGTNSTFPAGVTAVYFTFKGSLPNGTYRFGKENHPYSVPVPVQNGQLEIGFDNKVDNTVLNNGSHTGNLQKEISSDQFQDFCTGISYYIGNNYTTQTCKITFGTDPPSINQTVIANVSQAPSGKYKIFYIGNSTDDFIDKNKPYDQEVEVDKNGNGSFNFTINSQPRNSARLSLFGGGNYFCDKLFPINTITQPNTQPVCSVFPLEPNFTTPISINVTNLESGKDYRAAIIPKGTTDKKELIIQSGKSGTSKFEAKPDLILPEGDHHGEVYKFGGELVCTTKDFHVKGPGDITLPIKKCGDRDENGNEIICTTSSGNSCQNETDNRGPAIKTAIGCIHTNPAEFVKDLLTFLLGIGGGLAFLMMLLGAFQMLTSAGNPETLNAGKERLTSAIIGLLFIIFTILLLQIIGVGILNIPGFK